MSDTASSRFHYLGLMRVKKSLWLQRMATFEQRTASFNIPKYLCTHVRPRQFAKQSNVQLSDMMPKLKYENGFMSRDLTYREWPWQCWIASLSKEDMMVEAIGSGIYEFYVEIKSALRCPYSGTPQANVVSVPYSNIYF